MSYSSDCERVRRQQKLTKNKRVIRKYLVTNLLAVVFGFAERQDKATYGLGYKIRVTRSSDNSVLNKADATNKGKIKINSIEWFVPNYTPSMEQQKMISH